MTFGERLKALREKRCLNQDQLADLVGVSRSSYSHYENDHVQPNIDALIKLSDTFKVTIDYLLKGDDSEKAETLGDRLNLLRKENKLTQPQLSEKLELSLNMIKKLETDRVMPSIETLIKIAKLYKVSTDYLLGLKEDKPNDSSI